MKAVLLDAGQPESCEPLTSTRPLAACPVANLPLAEAQRRELIRAGFLPAPPEPGEPACYLRGDGWCPADALQTLREQKATALLDSEGTALAWVGTTPDGPEDRLAGPTPPDCFLIRYPWDLLRLHEALLQRVTADSIQGVLSPAAHVAGHLVLGAESEILPGVFIEGNVVVGRNVRIGPNTYLRGFTAVGDGCRIGHAVEIKNCIVMRDTHIAHLSYCGDSIIGERVNLGGGTIIANVRHDGRTHRSRVGRRLLETGRRKFGAVIGDDVHTGIHTSIYPGRKIWPHVSTRPGAVVADDLREPAAAHHDQGR